MCTSTGRPQVPVIMANQVKHNVSQVLRNLGKATIAYQKGNLKAVAETFEDTRERAGNEMIIPRRVPRRGPYYMRKLQPVSPHKLTERTGLLKNILTEKGTLNITRQSARLDGTRHVKVRVKTVAPTEKSINYIGTLRVLPKGNQDVKYRLAHEKGRRGVKARPFLWPATKKEFKNIKGKIRKEALRKLDITP